MPDPLTVTPAELIAAAIVAAGIAAALRRSIGATGIAVEVADVPTTGWLAYAAGHQVADVATGHLDAIAGDLATAAEALRAAALSYREADDRAARRYASGPLDPRGAGLRATPW